MSDRDESVAYARLHAELEAIREQLRVNSEMELEALIRIEEQLDKLVSDPRCSQLFRSAGLDVSLDLTSRASIRERRAQLEKQLGFRARCTNGEPIN